MEKKILMLHSSSDLYGASLIFSNVIKTLQEAGYKPIVLLSDEGPLVDKIRFLGVQVILIDLAVLRRKSYSLSGIINSFFRMIRAILKLRKIIKREGVQLVYSNTFAVITGAFAAKSLSIQHFYHIHEIIEKPTWLAQFFTRVLNWTSSIAVVVSDAVKRNLISSGVTAELVMVYNGLDYTPFLEEEMDLRSDFGFSVTDVVIGVVGRIHFWKGQDYFVEICKDLQSRGLKAKYLVVGDVVPGYENLEISLKSKIQDLNLENDFILTGFRSDIPKILNTIDLFVSPSILPDPLPTVILESMAAAKPVVATKHGGALEMIKEGLTGAFIPISDVTEAANVIDSILKRPEQLLEMGENGRKRVKKYFSKESFDEKIIQVIQKAIAN